MRGHFAAATLYAPELIDPEFANVMHRVISLRALASARANLAMDTWLGNDILRRSHKMLLPRIWQLHDNLTPYDASCLALAETLSVPLLTGDHGVARRTTLGGAADGYEGHPLRAPDMPMVRLTPRD
jgi:predicted nucleic acid-binding protein